MFVYTVLHKSFTYLEFKREVLFSYFTRIYSHIKPVWFVVSAYHYNLQIDV